MRESRSWGDLVVVTRDMSSRVESINKCEVAGLDVRLQRFRPLLSTASKGVREPHRGSTQ